MNQYFRLLISLVLLLYLMPKSLSAQQVADAWVYGGNNRLFSKNCYVDLTGNRYQLISTSANNFTVDSLGYTITITKPPLSYNNIHIIKFNTNGVYQYHISISETIHSALGNITFDKDNNAYFSARISTIDTPYLIYDSKKTAHALPINYGKNSTNVVVGKLTPNGGFEWLRIIKRKNGNDLPTGAFFNFEDALSTNALNTEIKLITPNYRPLGGASPDTIIIASNGNLNDTIVVNSALIHYTFLSNGEFKNHAEPLKNQLSNTFDAVGFNGVGDEPSAGSYTHVVNKNKGCNLQCISIGLSAADTLRLGQNTPLYEGINYILICTNDNDSVLWAKSFLITLTWATLNILCDTNTNEFGIFFRFNPALDIITLDPALNNIPNLSANYFLKLSATTGNLNKAHVINTSEVINSLTWNSISKKYIFSSFKALGYLDSNLSLLSIKYPKFTNNIFNYVSWLAESQLRTDMDGYTYMIGSVTDSISFDCFTRYANPSQFDDKVLVIKIAPLISKDTFACQPIKSPSQRFLWDTTGVYYDTIPSTQNCDSILEIRYTNLTSKVTYDSTVNVFMKSPSLRFIWDSTGTYTDTLTNWFSCDSIITIKLHVLQTKNTIDTSVCDYLVSPSYKYKFITNGTFLDTIPNVAGADSILTINLKIGKSFSNIDTSFCNSITSPSGNYVYNQSGLYLDTIPNSIGCDSIISIQFNRTNTKDSIIVSSCNNYLSPSGKYTYNQSGLYTDTLKTTNGCDSLVFIHYKNLQTSSSLSLNKCKSTWSPSGKFNMYLTGFYSDTLTNANGCDSILTINFTLDTFIVKLTKSNDVTCDSPVAQLSLNSGNIFTWYANGVLLNSQNQTINVTPNETTVYKVIAQNNWGCEAIDSISVYVNKKDSSIITPNVFTPNNDGINDCFMIEGIEKHKQFTFEVFNRWGQQVYKTSNPIFCWDGKTNAGEEVNVGTYFYVLETTSACNIYLKANGIITIIR